MLFYQDRFDAFVATFTGTPTEFYHSKDARHALRFPVSLRKQRDINLWQNYAYAYAELYKTRNGINA